MHSDVFLSPLILFGLYPSFKMRIKISVLVLILFVICSNDVFGKVIRVLSDRSIQEQISFPNVTYIIKNPIDLKGDTITIPPFSVIKFKRGGSLRNGLIIGNNTQLKYNKPFIGDSLCIEGCHIIGKNKIKDVDVFLKVLHTQNEIQTLFDLSGGSKLVFSSGSYHNVERIFVRNNIDADFNNSTIYLFNNSEYVAECFYMEPWVNLKLDFVKLHNLKIEGKRIGIRPQVPRSCIQLFYVSVIELDGISLDKFDGGPNVFKSDASDLLDKTLLGTNIINLIKYDRCTIHNCTTTDVNKEIFWCVPNNDKDNITLFANNKSYCSYSSGSGSFFTILDGRCIVRDNEVYNYFGSAFNTLCYDSEITNNRFYNGKNSVAIDLSEGTMYKARNVYVHDNQCIDTKGLLAAYGENLIIENNLWINTIPQLGKPYSIITIKTRGEREPGGQYVGCDNNPELLSGTSGITIKNNTFINESSDNELNIRCAFVYGDKILFEDNKMIGMNAPAVHFVNCNDIVFDSNTIDLTRDDWYAELYIDYGKQITVTDNNFYHNHCINTTQCTVQIIEAEGQLVYKGNKVKENSSGFAKNKVYVPCYIEDDSHLDYVVIYVEDIDPNSNQLGTGVKSKYTRVLKNF